MSAANNAGGIEVGPPSVSGAAAIKVKKTPRKRAAAKKAKAKAR